MQAEAERPGKGLVNWAQSKLTLAEMGVGSAPAEEVQVCTFTLGKLCGTQRNRSQYTCGSWRVHTEVHAAFGVIPEALAEGAQGVKQLSPQKPVWVVEHMLTSHRSAGQCQLFLPLPHIAAHSCGRAAQTALA